MTEEGLKRLDQALNPSAVAIIGATAESDRVGYAVVESLIMGGFSGEILPIHPRHQEILGKQVYASLDKTPVTPDLAIVALNEHASIEAVKECGRFDVKAAVCVAAGYKEVGKRGAELERRLSEAANSANVLLIGPNTLGVMNAEARLNATFWPISLEPKGHVSLISQSGGVGQIIGFEMLSEGIPFNKWIGVGNRASMDFDDFLQYLLSDPSTDVIVAFIEGTEKARSFVDVAMEGAQQKPIIVMKAGKEDASRKFALTHTGSMAGSYKMYNDIFEQFGLITVHSIPEMISAAKALSLAPVPTGNRVGILTPTAGPSIILSDLLLEQGCQIPSFNQETMLDMSKQFSGVPVVLKNPLDASAAGYDARSYVSLAASIARDPNVDVLVAISIDHKNRTFPAQELVELTRDLGKPIVVYYICAPTDGAQSRAVCQEGGIPFYTSAEQAAWGTASLIRRRRAMNSWGGA